MKSLFRKIFFAFLAVIILFSSLIYFITYDRIKENNLIKLKVELRNYSDLISQQIEELIDLENYAKIDSIIKNIKEFALYRVTIIRNDGLVIADSENDAKSMDNHLLRPEIQESLNHSYGDGIRYSLTVRSDLLYVSREINKLKPESGFVRVSFWLKDINDEMIRFRNEFLQTVLYLSLLSTLIAFLLSRNLSKPIKQLAQFSKDLPEENFRLRIKYKSNNEIGELADNLNKMAENIETLFTTLESERESLLTIINNMSEGLIVFNTEQKIIMANNRMKEVLQFNRLENRFVWETVKSKELINYIKNLITTKKNARAEFAIDNIIYMISFSYLESKDEIICLFYDITEQRQLEIQKRDFVTNVSHELRTPLTSIQGFVETLQDEENNDDKKHYLSIIHRNTLRLINLVKDLMLLAKVEDDKLDEKTKVNIVDLIQTVLKIYNSNKKTENVNINYINEDKEIFVLADPFKLEQVFINLIDNAIKYSDDADIEISSRISDDNVIICIKDHGIGIPTDVLDRIFERFFVVDKSRSRKSGGTGLGLSLVKHIIQNHQGHIYVKSTVNQGTEFTIQLNLLIH